MVTEETVTKKKSKAEIRAEEKKKFEEKVDNFIEDVINRYKPKTVMGAREDLYFFIDGYYHSLAESMLKEMCGKEFDRANTLSLYGDILHKIKSHKMIRREDFVDPDNKINLLNGVLDVYNNTMEEHNSDYNFLYRIDIEYVPDEEWDCPQIKKFLMDISDGDENIFWLLVEFLGYTLTSGYKIKKFLCIFGDGDNGKTTLANLITAFVNQKNVSNLSLYQLCNKDFMSADLYGKKVNIRGESAPTILKSLETMKSLTGDDGQYFDRKFKDGIQFNNSTKFLFHFNELPNIDLKKLDTAALDRVMLIKLKRSFVSGEDDKNILKKLTTDTELKGLMHLALIGLKRLRDNRGFLYDNETTFDIWMDNLKNPLDEFIKECAEFRKDYYEEQIVVYDRYREHKSYNGMSKKAFTTNINKYTVVSIGKRGSAGEQKKCYTGIRLKR